MVILCFTLLTIYSQNDSTYFQAPTHKKEKQIKNSEWLEKISIGGNFSFLTNTRFTFVDISPLIGYRVSKTILVAAGPVYNYYSEYLYNLRYKFDIYGIRTMARVYFLESFFIQTGWDYLNRSIYVLQGNTIQQDRIWVQNLWIGGGIRYMFSPNAYTFTSILYNLNQTVYSPYPNPYIQIGFITGF